MSLFGRKPPPRDPPPDPPGGASNVAYLRAVTGEATAPELEPQAEPGITPPSRRGSSGRFLTDVIVDLGYVPRETVEEAVAAARSAGRPPEQILLDRGVIDSDRLSRAIAERHGLDHVDLGVFPVDMAAANMVDPSAAKRYAAVPVARLGDRGILVAMADPANVLAIDDIAMITQLEVKIAVASAEDVLALAGRLSRFEDAVHQAVEADEEDGPAELVELRESADDAPVVKLVNSIIAQAADRGASDIHFEPEQGEMRVRFRIDGVLQTASTIPRRMLSGVVSRVKIMADLDIAEKRLPQDGRVGLTIEDRHVDLRVVTLPSVHGESIVIRILDKSSVTLDLNVLGMQADELERFRRAFGQAYGAVLVTGPTGSGKSTSLYGALGELNTPEKNIITIEDPVEYEIEGITQVQVNVKTGLTFAQGLRAMMRADPDVVMVGEIRDRETAQIAIEAALTGHLVLSTLHTNDAPTAMARLMEMGVEPFLVASAIDCVVAQRLARQLCSTCKKRTIIPAAVLREHGYQAQVDVEAYEPAGCGRCNNLGYKGRIGLYEVMALSDEMRQLVLERAPADQIAELAERQGMRRIREDGLDKVKQGITAMAEVARVAGTS